MEDAIADMKAARRRGTVGTATSDALTHAEEVSTMTCSGRTAAEKPSILALAATLVILAPSSAKADAGGVSFWLPGTFGGLAATPVTPGWSYETMYIHLQQYAGAGREFGTSGGARGSVVTGLNARADVLVEGVTCTSALPVFGGQAAFTLLAAPGNLGVGIDATLTGPRGNTISGSRSDNRTTLSDVFYQGTLKWNQGVHNEMVYIAGKFQAERMTRIDWPI
ncbi:hypothetical protein [Bradyrhizobium sp. BRP22]|uniref:hypothetical protein n=1 Tax=Bradyrhizobium sp. BRP22 TaxID=2793821 RepID=UPI0031FC8CC0